MRAVLIVASALALAVALVIAMGSDEEDDAPVVETTPVTAPETVPEPAETTPEKPIEPEPADPDAPANGHGGQEAPVRCGQIAFEPNTDSGASGIKAAGTDCTAARTVARAARDRTEDLSYRTDGFQCSGARSDQLPIATVEWFCVGPDREVVTFKTS